MPLQLFCPCCFVSLHGWSRHLCLRPGCSRNRLQPLRCHYGTEVEGVVEIEREWHSAQARENGNSAPCCLVSLHGVEQPFMPAAKLLKKSASAAEVPLLHGGGR